MKKFLLTISLFLTFCASLFVLAVLISVYRVSQFEFKLPEKVDTIVIGHSMVECAIDDSLLENVINWGHSGDYYVETYERLRFLLRNGKNKGLKRVFVSMSPHNISPTCDRYFYSDKFLKSAAIRYYPIIGLKNSFEICGFDFITELLINPIEILYTAIAPENLYFKSLGAYNPSSTNCIDLDIKKDWKIRWSSSNSTSEYGNKITYGYFRKISDECKKYGIKVYALVTPVYDARTFFNKPFFNRNAYNDFFSEYNKNFGDIEIWNYIDYKLPKTHYRDINHLNVLGAKIFTGEFERRLKSEALKK